MDDAEFRRKAHEVLVELEVDRGTESDFPRCPKCFSVSSPEDRRHLRGCILGALVEAGPGAPPRCERCGWPLAATIDEGCVAGNCSYRPHEGTEEHARMQRRDEELARAKAAAVLKVVEVAGPHGRPIRMVELGTVRFVCPSCGPGVRADEDGCCVECGADVFREDAPWFERLVATRAAARPIQGASESSPRRGVVLAIPLDVITRIREAHRLMVEELTGDAPPANRKARVQRLLEELVDKWDGRTE